MQVEEPGTWRPEDQSGRVRRTTTLDRGVGHWKRFDSSFGMPVRIANEQVLEAAALLFRNCSYEVC